MPLFLFGEETSSSQSTSLQLKESDISDIEKTDSSPLTSESTLEQKQQAKITGSAKTVTAIEIRGNKVISESVIMSKIKTRVNQPYYSKVARDDIKRLYATGFFSDISVDLEEDKAGGIKVIFTVKEKPIINKIDFEGMRILRKDLLLRNILKSKVDQYLDYNQLREDVQTIKNEYQKRGYSKAEINYDIKINGENNRADIIFKIKEDKRIQIRRIYIRGNKYLSSRKILRAIKTRQKKFFSAGYFNEGQFKDDLERIKILYTIEGFPDAEIKHSLEYDDRGGMYITLDISEGQQYLVGNVVIKGNKSFTEKELKQKIEKMKPGNIFNQLDLQKDAFNIQNFYLSKGYLFAQVQEASSINPKTGTVDVSYTITENDIYYVERIDIRGNTKTKDKVIRREIRLKPGDKFDGQKLARSKERLDNLGYFEEVVFDNEPASKPNFQNLIVDVKEAQTGQFSFGGGYSSIDEFVGFVEIEQRNFDIFNWPYFTGGGQDLKIRAELGSVRENYFISFTEPWIFDRPLSFGFDIYKSVHDRETDVGYAYNERRVGGDIRLGKQFSEYIKGESIYRLEEIEISDISEEASGDLKKEAGKTLLSSMEFNLQRDTRDNVFNPSKGILMSGSIECTGGIFGGDKDFLKLFGLFSKYFSLWNKSVIEAKLRCGIVFPFSDTDYVPIYSRFFAGGADTIRGYNERKVGPIDPVSQDPLGGQALLVGNIEYSYPIMDFVKLATFFDVGNVWMNKKDFASGGYKSSVGVGVRVKTPIGPIKLDYGIPLQKEEGKEGKEGRFHFSMSRGF